MSLESLVEIIHNTPPEWTETNKKVFNELFGGPQGRYPLAAKKKVTLRAPAMSADSGVSFAAYINEANPPSGAYGGTSFVIFPGENSRSLVGLVVGTQGLAPDEAILGRPGHARKARAICDWLNSKFGAGAQVAWSKQDPTRTDIKVPESVRANWSVYDAAFEKYGGEMYAMFQPNEERATTRNAVAALLDLFFADRSFGVMSSALAERDRIATEWSEHLLPVVTPNEVNQLLGERRYVVLQGPPGTGKTKMATDLLATAYQGRGKTVQFHANTTYEGFIGGLAPVHSSAALGLRFEPRMGWLMEAAKEAREDASPYLLHIDEINRADLSKVLGEAIFLLESQTERERVVDLQYDFGEPFHRELRLPGNLHVLGTMNTADRSIAIVDVAVRRRFSFLSLWPQMSVVKDNGCQLMQSAFQSLLSLFIEHAPDDAFNLVPGHSYFLETDDGKARRSLKTNLAPLLEEYLSQGYAGGFAEPIRSYLQWIRSL